MIRLIIIAIVTTTFYCASAQDDNPLSGNGYIGHSVLNLNLKPKGFSDFSGMKGVEVSFSGMNFAYYEGQVRRNNADSTVGNPFGKFYNIGYRIGPENWRIGSSSFLSASVKPYLQVSGSYASMGNKVLNTGDNVASAGIVFSPGLQIRFSHLYLSASYNAGLYLNTTFFGGNYRHNLAKGFIGGTTFTIGLENAFDLLSPKQFSLKGYNVTKKTYSKDNGLKSDRRGLYREIVTTTVTSYSIGERIMSLVRPFWGIGPTYSFKSIGKGQAPTAMRGANFGIRAYALMLDGFYEQGEVGLKDDIKFTEIVKAFPRLRNYDFSSQVMARSYGGRLGLNLTKFFALNANFIRDYESKLISKLKVPFTRLSGYYTMGVTEFMGNPNYTYTNGAEMLAEFQDKKGITPNASNNANYIPERAEFSGWGLSVEVGSAFINGTWYKYKDAAVADHFHFTVGANIPLGRVFHSTRLRYSL